MTGRGGRKSQIFVLNSQASFPPGAFRKADRMTDAGLGPWPGRLSAPGAEGRRSGAAGQRAPGLRCLALVPPPLTRLQTGPWGLSRWHPDRTRILLCDDLLLQSLFPCLEPSEGPRKALHSQQGLARFVDNLADMPLPCLHQSSAPMLRPSLHLQQVLARVLSPTTRSPFPGSLCAGVSGVSAPHLPAHHSGGLIAGSPGATARNYPPLTLPSWSPLPKDTLGSSPPPVVPGRGAVCRACIPR